MQGVERKDSDESYTENDKQVLLSKFLSGEIQTLEPTFDCKEGYRYPLVEAILGDSAKVELFLSKLHEEGILERKLADKVISCPNCSSNAITFRYCCPYCKSFNIQKSSLTEHVKCGYMDIEENFRKGGKLVCPKCGEELKSLNGDYRKAGVWCQCRECKKTFDAPVAEHFCTSCRTVSNFEQSIIKDVYVYTLSPSMKEKMSGTLFLVAPIRKFFQEEGMKVESPALLKGKSGAKHSFDIVAYGTKGTGTLVMDLAIATDSAVSEQPVIALFAKIFDVSPDRVFLVAVPKLNDNAKKMAELYSIQTVEARNQNEVLSSLKEKL